jgi:GNAT superfamily N-acetyltransferase
MDRTNDTTLKLDTPEAAHVGDQISYRPMRPGEERQVADLVIRSFQEFIGPHYPRAGIRDFLAYASPQAITGRVARDHVVLVAAVRNAIIGVVDIDDYSHIDLFFVDKRWHGKHVGHELMVRTIELCLEAQPNLREITADTSEFGLPAYLAMGFERAGAPQVSHGRNFMRVRRKLGRQGRR